SITIPPYLFFRLDYPHFLASHNFLNKNKITLTDDWKSQTRQFKLLTETTDAKSPLFFVLRF
ncbi:hypothetical protein BK133_30860, partial [Paenibacillus sp. FSL H8-0548]